MARDLYWHTIATLPKARRLFDTANKARRHLQLFLLPGGSRALELHEDAQGAIVEALIQHAYSLGKAAAHRRP